MASKEGALKCCTQFWRILFLILNIVFLVIGLALVGLGIYLLASRNDLQFLTGNEYASGGTLILISGIVTFIIAFIGIVGAAGMFPIVLTIYIIVILLIVILEIVAGVLGFVYRVDVVNFTAERALDAIEGYVDGANNDINAVVDFMQNSFACCGFDSYDEWLGTNYFNVTGRFPDSCNCTNTTNTLCLQAPVGALDQMIYDRNCSGSVRVFIEQNLIVIGAVGIVFGLIELFGLFVAIGICICSCVLRKNKEDYEFNKAI